MVEFSSNIRDIHSLYVQALDGSFNWQDTKIKRWKAKVNPGTTLFMNSFPSRIAGIREHKWKLYDERDILMAEINNEFLIWTFCNSGNYSVELEVSDIENNTYKVRRNGFIEVGNPKVVNHYIPGLGWTPPTFPENVPEPPLPVPPPVAYQPPSLVSAPTLKYYATYSLTFTNVYYSEENKDASLSLTLSWESKEIRNASLYAREFFIEYLDTTNGKILTTRFDIDKTSDGSDIDIVSKGFYNAVPNQTYEEYLNENTVGRPFKNISIWKFPPNNKLHEEFWRIRQTLLDSYTLNPSQFVGYDIGSLNLFKIYFIPTTTSNN